MFCDIISVLQGERKFEFDEVFYEKTVIDYGRFGNGEIDFCQYFV